MIDRSLEKTKQRERDQNSRKNVLNKRENLLKKNESKSKENMVKDTSIPQNLPDLIPLSEESSIIVQNEEQIITQVNVSRDLISSTSTLRIASSPKNNKIKPGNFKKLSDEKNEIFNGNSTKKKILDDLNYNVEDFKRKSEESERILDLQFNEEFFSGDVQEFDLTETVKVKDKIVKEIDFDGKIYKRKLIFFRLRG